MTKPNKRISRSRTSRKSSLKFPVTAAAREFHQRYRRAERFPHCDALPENASRKAIREALAKDQAVRNEHKASVQKYLARFYKFDETGGVWTRPKPLKSMVDIVELAVAGLEDVGASRALSIAIVRAAGLRIF
jgi:hypothetical protein